MDGSASKPAKTSPDVKIWRIAGPSITSNISGAIIGLSNSRGYLLPAIIGLEPMGIPSPGETALVAAAVLASQGKLEIWLVILIGVTWSSENGDQNSCEQPRARADRAPRHRVR